MIEEYYKWKWLKDINVNDLKVFQLDEDILLFNKDNLICNTNKNELRKIESSLGRKIKRTKGLFK